MFCGFRVRRLYRVHEALFGAVEEDDGEEHYDNEGEGTIYEVHSIEGAGTDEGVFEDFEDWGEGVDVDNPAILLWGEAQWVDDWGCIHQELDAEGDEHVEVTVLGGHRGDDETPRHGVHADHEDGE